MAGRKKRFSGRAEVISDLAARAAETILALDLRARGNSDLVAETNMVSDLIARGNSD